MRFTFITFIVGWHLVAFIDHYTVDVIKFEFEIVTFVTPLPGFELRTVSYV